MCANSGTCPQCVPKLACDVLSGGRVPGSGGSRLPRWSGRGGRSSTRSTGCPTAVRSRRSSGRRGLSAADRRPATSPSVGRYLSEEVPRRPTDVRRRDLGRCSGGASEAANPSNDGASRCWRALRDVFQHIECVECMSGYLDERRRNGACRLPEVRRVAVAVATCQVRSCVTEARPAQRWEARVSHARCGSLCPAAGQRRQRRDG